ncbi:MAG TPA: hypothetical protein VFC09_06475 [Candidatus Dormibacteraeota bacterium]|nr:hypothetical protein [Candidatus Dormibacteraeota bacterium]
MSRTNKRKRPAAPGVAPAPPAAEEPRPQRRPLVQRRMERIENAPGYGNAAPWSVRGVLTLYALMLVLNLPVAAIAQRLEGAPNYLTAAVSPDVFLFLLYALLAMPGARRLAGEPRSMRPLESISAGALMYLLYYGVANLVANLIPGGPHSDNLAQVAEVGLGAVAGGAIGAVLFPLLYRRLWMPRLPGARGPRP